MSSKTPDRFWEACIREMFSKFGSKPDEQDLKTVAYLYEGAGGLWEQLAAADADAWNLLRRSCKVYLKHKKKRELNAK